MATQLNYALKVEKLNELTKLTLVLLTSALGESSAIS